MSASPLPSPPPGRPGPARTPASAPSPDPRRAATAIVLPGREPEPPGGSWPATVPRRAPGRTRSPRGPWTVRSGARGLTLLELLCVLALLAALAGAALPDWQGARQRRAVEGAAAELQAWLQDARALVMARREGAWLQLDRTPDGGPCLLLHGGARAADCRCEAGAAVCDGALQPWRTLHREGAGVRLSANVAAMRLEPRRGQVVPAGTLRLHSADGRTELRLIVNPLGRVRACAAGGLAGWPPCA